MGEGEDGTTSSESEEDMWNKEPSHHSEDDEEETEEDDDIEMSGVNKDGMEEGVKEVEHKPPDFSLDYTLEDLFDAELNGKDIELTKIETL